MVKREIKSHQITVWSYSYCEKCEELSAILDEHGVYAHFPWLNMFDGDGKYMEEELFKITRQTEIP
jgi:hypothetical protein